MGHRDFAGLARVANDMRRTLAHAPTRTVEHMAGRVVYRLFARDGQLCLQIVSDRLLGPSQLCARIEAFGVPSTAIAEPSDGMQQLVLAGRGRSMYVAIRRWPVPEGV